MPNTAFENIGDAHKQQVAEDMTEFFENNAPTYNVFQDKFEEDEITEKGVRIPFWSRRPGGHTGFLPSNSDFNPAVPPQSNSMWGFPVGYALPTVMNGVVIRSFQKRKTEALTTFRGLMELYTETATKRLNQMCHGDGSGALAFSASAIGGTGVTSCNFTTTAAATPGQTKGAVRLEEGHSYNAINPATGAIRGTFTVNITGKSSATINVTSGTIAVSDPIVDLNSYNRYFRGLWHLIGNTSRVLQGLNTANFSDLNDPIVDLNGQLLTPAAFRSVKTSLQTRNNKEDAENSLFSIGTFGQYTVLCKQGYNLRFYVNGNNGVVTGVASEYQDGDTVFVRDADGDEDRNALMQAEALKMYKEMEFGLYDLDNQEWRMLLGVNGTGSDNYQQAMGCRNCLVKMKTRKTAGIIRASLTGVETQVNT
jgi:hypothetical protein